MVRVLRCWTTAVPEPQNAWQAAVRSAATAALNRVHLRLSPVDPCARTTQRLHALDATSWRRRHHRAQKNTRAHHPTRPPCTNVHISNAGSTHTLLAAGAAGHCSGSTTRVSCVAGTLSIRKGSEKPRATRHAGQHSPGCRCAAQIRARPPTRRHSRHPPLEAVEALAALRQPCSTSIDESRLWRRWRRFALKCIFELRTGTKYEFQLFSRSSGPSLSRPEDTVRVQANAGRERVPIRPHVSFPENDVAAAL